MKPETQILRELVTGMRAAYARGENAMAYARTVAGASGNSTVATLVAYDLQAGSYVAAVRQNRAYAVRWCAQLAEILRGYTTPGGSLLEVGCGEETTLAGVLRRLPANRGAAYGFDLSWSRCAVGQQWLDSEGTAARLFVGDLFEIPLADESIDVVYTSHSLEPNGGRERAALQELLRVARTAVVLIEPVYELAGEIAQTRMREHGYVRNLKATAESLGMAVVDYRLLDHCDNRLNPSGVIAIRKPPVTGSGDVPNSLLPRQRWRCPLTGTALEDVGDTCYSSAAGIAYPVLRGIPLLRPEHAVLASHLGTLPVEKPVPTGERT